MDVISLLSNELPKLAVALPVLGGAWAFLRLRGQSTEPSGRRTAFRLATALGGIGWVGGTVMVGMLSGMLGSTPNWAVAALWGVAVGILTHLSTLFGYVALGGRRGGVVPVIGALLGPLLLMGGPIFAWSQVRTIAERSYEDAQAARDAERSSFLHVTASPVSVTRGSNAGAAMTSIRLEVTVRSDRAFAMSADPTTPTPYFSMSRRDPVIYAGAEAAAGSPLRYEPGREVRYEVSMSVSEAAGIQGRWTLAVSFNGDDGLRYIVRVPIDLPAPTSG